jgi:uncharacterized protein (DUF885 family)
MDDSSVRELEQLFQDEWEFRLHDNPIFATYAGDHRFGGRLPCVKEEDYVRRQKTLKGFLDRLEAVDHSALREGERLNYDFFQRELRLQLSELEFKSHYFPITKSAGVPVYLPDVVSVTPFRSVEDYEKYIRRLEGFAELATDLIGLMRAGMNAGYMPSPAAMAGVVESFRMHAEGRAGDEALRASVFFGPFLNFPTTVPDEERTRLLQAGQHAIQTSLAPGYQRLADFLETEYLPNAPQALATLQMPVSKTYYEFCVRRFTSLEITPEEVHQIGLAEVSRIRAEMGEVMEAVGFHGTLRAFADSLRSDPRFFVDTPEQLMKEVAWLMKRIEGQLPKLFKVLPRTPFGLREIPAYIAPNSTSAYYFLPAGDGTTAGFYYVNTYDLKSRPLYEYEALSLHEAVPGHHLQLALQLEMDNIPEFRKWGETTAFIEGWALYAERLGLEMGFYQDPYSNFGRLVYEMWRAARLVVDTGLHYFDWTRQQAIDFLAENTALSLLNIANEVDRYISWPGQAVAYKIGELRIRALRQQAEEALGANFDVREFHYVLLRSGGIPLTVLEANVAEWIKNASR